MSPRFPVRVLSAVYSKSGPAVAALGPPVADEIAFVGRSNVGKSSLLNALLSRRDLVRVSRTPGQTRMVNLFDVEVAKMTKTGNVGLRRHLTFADLPGYGYAHTSIAERHRLSETISEYLSTRERLRCICQLFDVRHPASAQDVEVHNQIAKRDVLHVLVATKADKVASSHRQRHLKAVAAPLGLPGASFVLFSAHEAIGFDALWQRIWSGLAAIDEDAVDRNVAEAARVAVPPAPAPRANEPRAKEPPRRPARRTKKVRRS